MRFGIYVADVVEWAKGQPEASFDACFCDPPYGLQFMGVGWDTLDGREKGLKHDSSISFDRIGGHYHPVDSKDRARTHLSENRKSQLWHEQWAKEIFRILKPGAFLLAFGGTRTHHRLTCAIEDAGFEIRDCLMWLYGSGFPKSLDVSKAIDKAAGAEREVVGHKGGRYNSPGTDIRGGRFIGGTPGKMMNLGDITAPATDAAKQWDGWGTALKPAWEPIILAMKPLDGTFAENALKHGVAGLNVDGCRVGTEQISIHGYKGDSFSQSYKAKGSKPELDEYRTATGRWPANVILDEETGRMLDEDSGGASRFFYSAKASKAERDAGLEGSDRKQQDPGRKEGGPGGDNLRNRGLKKRTNYHPTVKPIDLCRYLSSLLLSPRRETPRRLFVPFAGSGSEMIGALLAGWDDIVGVEKEEEYVKIARLRIRHWVSLPKQHTLDDFSGE